MQSFFKVFCWYYPVSIKYNFQLGIGDKKFKFDPIQKNI